MGYQFTCFGGIIEDSSGGEVKPRDTWENMAEWLSGSFAWIRAGSVLQLEPEGITDFSTDAAVVCAQVRKLDDGALWLRLSDRSLGVPNVARLSAEGLALDVWQDEDLLEDCTEAQMFSRDAELLADVCVTWFRDRRDFDSPDEVGWEYEPPEELPRLLRYHDPRPPRDDQLEDLDDLAHHWALRQDEDAFWCDDKTLAMTVYDVQLRLVVRPRKRKLTIAAVLDLDFDWPGVLDEERDRAEADLRDRVEGFRLRDICGEACIARTFHVTKSIHKDLRDQTEALLRMARSVSGSLPAPDLVRADVKAFNEWRFEWGLMHRLGESRSS